MKINAKTWPLIEAKLNLIYEKEKIKQQKPKIYGQKPGNYKRSTQKSIC